MPLILIFFSFFHLCECLKWPPPHLIEEMKPTHEKCVAKTGVTEGKYFIYNLLIKGIILTWKIKHFILFIFDSEAIKEFSDGQIHEDDKLKCYMSCVFHETGMMDTDDKVNLVRVHEVFEYDGQLHMIVINMMRKCLYPQGENMCEKAFFLHKCWKNADPKVHENLITNSIF